jgi:integrase
LEASIKYEEQKRQQLQNQELQTAEPMTKFMYALKAKESKRQYPRRFKMFLDFLGLQGTINEQAKQFLENTKRNPQWTEDEFMDFVSFQLQRVSTGEIAESTIKNYYRPTKLFCEMNGCAQLINWKMISRGLPKGRQAANDRAPTMEEIQRLIQYPDRRIKAIVSTMVSSGIRIGAWDYLRWKHVLPMTNDKGEMVVSKLIVYAGDAEEYYTFITPEAYNLLKDWMDFRASYGEKITGESWVMRDIWQTTNITYGANLGLATCPKKLKSSGIKRLLERALWEQHVRQPLQNGSKRHEWKAAHGFRKFYKSRAEQVMKPINVEKTMGHNIGVSQSYYKPTEREVMEDYLKAVPLLTIESHNIILQKKVEQLTEKSRDSESTIRAKLEEKDNQIQTLIKKQEQFEQLIQSLIDSGQLKSVSNNS